MLLHGLGKLTLLDYPGHLACTAFTGACNFRCPFCHNALLVLNPASCESIDEETFFRFLASRKGKLEGVCVTGGEPTLQKDLSEFLARIRTMGFLIKLDTNGYEPSALRPLIEQRLVDMVAMDIKNSPASYAVTAGLPPENFDIDKIETSISLLISSGIPHEFRTTVVKELHTREHMRQIGEWLSVLSGRCTGNSRCSSPYYLQNFRASEHLICNDETMFHPLTDKELTDYVSLLLPYLPNTKIRGE